MNFDHVFKSIFLCRYYLTGQLFFLLSRKVSFSLIFTGKLTFLNCVTFEVRVRHILMYVVYYYIAQIFD